VIVGVPAEIKTEEYRIAITPVVVEELVSQGHTVIVESGAGIGSSITDEELLASGASVVATAAEIFETADLILKVKEPQLTEIEMLSEGQGLFTYLHLAAYPKQAEALVESGVTAVAYETVQLPSGELPMLTPMSEIAGRMAAQAGANYMERPHGGRGILIGGATGVPPAEVVVVGAGHAGKHATMVAAGMGARVTVLDIKPGPLREIDELRLGRVVTVQSSKAAIDHYIPKADLLIGAVLVTGARAPVVVTAEHIRQMRPGSVVVDISIDQGGCIETAKETTHAEPTYVVDNITHYAVGNIPGAVPNTSTYALTNATMPYAAALANGMAGAVRRYPELMSGVNVAHGSVTNAAVAAALGYEYRDPAEVLGLSI
jgi:alanine dehydrogenase